MTVLTAAPGVIRRPHEVLRPRVCPRGHQGKIWVDAYRRDTDKHRTVVFRCTPANGSPRHRFTWPDRMRWQQRDPYEPFHCAACEAAYRVGFGDHIGHRFDYAYRDVAELLLAVGRGRSFRGASSDLRSEARRWQDGIPYLTSREAQLAQSYVDAFAPLILSELADTDWPRVVAIDQLPLHRRRIAAGKAQPAGFEAGLIGVALEHNTQRSRPVLIQMMGGKDQVAWKGFLTSLAGRPDWIVADRDAGLEAALEDLGWLAAGTVLYRCEAHLSLNAEKAAQLDGLLEWRPTKLHNPKDDLEEIRRLTEPRRGRKKRWERTDLFLAISKAPQSRAAWNHLKRLVEAKVPAKKTKLRTWIATTEREVMQAQWQVRPGEGSLLPMSTGGVENSIGTIKHALENRGVQFGNLARLNKMLGLMCVQMSGKANRERYEELIRRHFDATPRHTAQQDWRGHFDTGHNSSIDDLIVRTRVAAAQILTSVWTPPAQARKQAKVAARKQALGVKPRPRRADGGGKKSYSVAGLSVADVPVIGDEWFTAENGGRDPKDVPASSTEKVKWRCLVDPRHVWEARVIDRCARRPGCRYCMGQAVLPEDSFGAKSPLAAEWDQAANGTLTPFDVAPQSNKVVGWICPKGHHYRRQIQHRTIAGLGCTHPDCKPVPKTSAGVRRHMAQRQRRLRRLAKAGPDWLAGDTAATGLGPTTDDTAALNAARANLERLLTILDSDRLAALLGRSASSLRDYRTRTVPSKLVARRLRFLAELADALAPHGDLAAWLERPHTRLGDQAPQDLLLRESDWDPIKAGPATLLMLAKQPREGP